MGKNEYCLNGNILSEITNKFHYSNDKLANYLVINDGNRKKISVKEFVLHQFFEMVV